MTDPAADQAIKIIEIDHKVRQTATEVVAIREDVRVLGTKIEKLIELQIQAHHTNQAITRAFEQIKVNRDETWQEFSDVEKATRARVQEWELWRQTFESERGKIIAELTSTISAWKGGMRMFWIVSALVWGVIATAGGYYIDQTNADRDRIAGVAKQAAERLRVVEIYLAKDPNYRPAQ